MFNFQHVSIYSIEIYQAGRLTKSYSFALQNWFIILFCALKFCDDCQWLLQTTNLGMCLWWDWFRFLDKYTFHSKFADNWSNTFLQVIYWPLRMERWVFGPLPIFWLFKNRTQYFRVGHWQYRKPHWWCQYTTWVQLSAIWRFHTLYESMAAKESCYPLLFHRLWVRREPQLHLDGI